MRRFGKPKHSAPRRPRPSSRGRSRTGQSSVVGSLWILTLAAGIGVVAATGIEPARALSFARSLLPAGVKQPARLSDLARPMPVCGSARRVSCIVDGDTFWLSGEKIRLEGIDAPEVNGACAFERRLAQQATHRLSEILSNQEIRLSRNGRDRYGRTLARAKTNAGEAGDILEREGLARPWAGRREPWCV